MPSLNTLTIIFSTLTIILGILSLSISVVYTMVYLLKIRRSENRKKRKKTSEILYCHHFFRPLSKSRLYSITTTKTPHLRVKIRYLSGGTPLVKIGLSSARLKQLGKTLSKFFRGQLKQKPLEREGM